MKVLYELDLNDIIRIVSEKYGVPQEKVKKTNKDGLNYLMIDMSDTETPGEFESFRSGRITKEEMKQLHDLSMEMFHPKKEAPAPEKKEPEKTQDSTPTEVVSDDQELQYKKITDEVLQSLIKAGFTIPDICQDFCLKDSKYSARLYKRAEKFRLEGARLGRRKSNNTETEKA